MIFREAMNDDGNEQIYDDDYDGDESDKDVLGPEYTPSYDNC